VARSTPPFGVFLLKLVRSKLPICVGVAILVGLCCTAAVSQGQPVRVKAKFLIDEKETKKPFRIILSANGVITEPSISADGSFLLPTLNAERVDVRLVSVKYNLFYEGIYFGKLAGPLTFQVFTSASAFKRLSDLDFNCKPGQKLVTAYNLDYGDGTEVTVTTCK
jgi:hypothetical protein